MLFSITAIDRAPAGELRTGAGAAEPPCACIPGAVRVRAAEGQRLASIPTGVSRNRQSHSCSVTCIGS
jgi:hypothetical protein